MEALEMKKLAVLCAVLEVINIIKVKVSDCGGGKEYSDSEKEEIALQPTSSYREVRVPVKIQGQGPAERPFPIPQAYIDALRSQQETVDSLRKLVCSDEFDLSTKRTMEMVIQMRFKEWLSATGNVRQILDLVNIERSRGSQSSNVSPMKDRA